MLSFYKSARRKAVSLLNGVLLPWLGVKLERALPDRFRFEKAGRRDGYTVLSVIDQRTNERVPVELREGTSDWMSFDQIFLDEDYDLRPLTRYAELYALYGRICESGTPLIVDLGGNIGLSSLYFSLIWPKARVVAVEPDESNFVLLSRNIASRPAIEALLAGASSRKSRLRIADSSAGKNAFTTTLADENEASIEGITVNDILARYPASSNVTPFVLKVDIEGAEDELFSGALDWIDRFPLIVIELHDWLLPGKGTSRNFLKAISEFDRDFVYIDENVFSIRNDRTLGSNSRY